MVCNCCLNSAGTAQISHSVPGRAFWVSLLQRWHFVWHAPHQPKFLHFTGLGALLTSWYHQLVKRALNSVSTAFHFASRGHQVDYQQSSAPHFVYKSVRLWALWSATKSASKRAVWGRTDLVLAISHVHSCDGDISATDRCHTVLSCLPANAWDLPGPADVQADWLQKPNILGSVMERGAQVLLLWPSSPASATLIRGVCQCGNLI